MCSRHYEHMIFQKRSFPGCGRMSEVINGCEAFSWLSVYNETSEICLLDRVRNCTSFVCRLRGLTFKRSLSRDEGLLLVGSRESRVDSAIHMFFVFFSIAVVWLDRELTVVDVQLARPFAPVYIPCARAQSVLEGPPRIMDQVSIGDKLRFEGYPRVAK